MKNTKGPDYVLRDSDGAPKTDLLDAVLKRGEQNLKAEGIDLDAGKKAEEEVTTNWEGIDRLSNSVRNGIMTAAETLDNAWNGLKQFEFPHKEEVQLQFDTTNNDLIELSDKWATIQKRHDGMTGTVLDGTDLSLSLGISSDYTMLSEQVKATIFPTMLAMTEATHRAKAVLDENEKPQEEAK